MIWSWMLLALFIFSTTLEVEINSLSITCRIMGIGPTMMLPIASNVLDRSSIVRLCQTLSEMLDCGEVQTIVSIDNLINVEVSDATIIDFIPEDLIIKTSEVTTLSHVFHSSHSYSNLERRFNDFLDKSNADSAASKKEFKEYVDKSNADSAASEKRFYGVTAKLVASKKEFKEYVDKSNADSAASKKEFKEYVDKSNADSAATKKKLDVVQKDLLRLVSERGTIQVIDNVYAAIFAELNRTGQFKEYKNLSSLLSSKSVDKATKEPAIIKALSAISGIPSADQYWKALHNIKLTRNNRQHADLRSQEEAFEMVDDFLKPNTKSWSPSSSDVDLKTILYKMIPLMYKSKNEDL